MSGLLNQTVTVANKPGGSGVIAVQAVRQAPADGHTMPVVAAYNRSALAWFGQPIAIGIARGEIAPHNDPATTTVILQGAMRGVMLQWLVDPRLPLAAVRDRLLQLAAQALRQA